MLFIVFQITLLFLFVFLMGCLLTTNKWLRQIIFVFGILFTTLEISSVVLGSTLIDYKYYMHLNTSVVAGTGGFFLKEGIILTAVFIILLLLINFLSRRFSVKIRKHKWKALLLALLSIGGMSVEDGVVGNIVEILQLHFAKKKQFKEALHQLDLKDYVKKDAIKATAGKNIVVLILESVEASFLKDNMEEVTPNMRRMAREMNYYNMKPAKGSDYTIGAVYTYFTGFPHFFKNHGNDVFANSAELKISSISNALSVAGYQQLYMLGNPDFAGTRQMLNLMDIDVKSEENYDPKYTLDYWGLHDKDLFELAQKEILNLKEKPFALYLSTISTHHPDGVLDPRVINEFPPQKSELELMTRSLDERINELILFLEKENLLENTAVFILPDHTLMGKASRVLNDFTGPRDLFLISNVASPSYDTSKNIFQIDIPKIILEGAEVKHNLRFLSDVVKDDKLNFINKNKHKIIQLNEASLTAFEEEGNAKENKTPPVKLTKEVNKIYLRSESWANDNIKADSYMNVGLKEIKAKRGVNLLVHENGDYQHEVFDTYQDSTQVESLLSRLQFLVESKQYFATLVHNSAGHFLETRQSAFKSIGFQKLGQLKNRTAYIAISKHGFTSEQNKKKLVELKLLLTPPGSIRTPEEIATQSTDPARLIAHAGGAWKGNKYTNSIEALNDNYKKGFRLFELDIIKTTDGHFVACHDWPYWKKKTGYQGDIPVDLKTFHANRTVLNYTPTDLDMINDWFTAHPDAILITDKINDPETFIPEFIDPSRLMMELFSFGAIEKAQQLGIKEAILSESVWAQNGKLHADELKKLNITSMAISRRTIDADRERFIRLKEGGINVYAFHVNSDPFKDEAYMLHEGLDFCFGLYADFWVGE